LSADFADNAEQEKAPENAQTKLSTGGEVWFIFEPFVLSGGYSFCVICG
jgi:hypothetical protein